MSAFRDPCKEENGIFCLPYGSNVSQYDPARVVQPFEGIDFVKCNSDLIASDFDNDGKITMTEYETFVSRTAGNICIDWRRLTLGQKGNFNSLACQCVSHTFEDTTNQGGNVCCLGTNAHIPTNGAADIARATEPEAVFLENVCLATYGTLPGGNCSIAIYPVKEPPPIAIAPFNLPRSGTPAEGSDWNLLAPIIASLLLLCLFCCCCCVLRRRRRKDEQEEELIETEYPGKEEWLETPMPEQVSRSAPPIMVPPPPVETSPEPSEYSEPEEFEEEMNNVGGGHDDDEWSDGEGRRARGGNYAIEDEEDTKRRWPGGEYIPPEKEKEQVVLKPIPDKEPPPEEPWDEPGRNIEEVKPDPDEISAQEFDPYVPDTGVYNPQRPEKEPVTWKNDWERSAPPEDDEMDGRKHRIQSGMGQGEIWDRLDNDSASKSTTVRQTGDVFDWVVKSALEVMDGADKQGFLEGDDESTVPPTQDN